MSSSAARAAVVPSTRYNSMMPPRQIGNVSHFISKSKKKNKKKITILPLISTLFSQVPKNFLFKKKKLNKIDVRAIESQIPTSYGSTTRSTPGALSLLSTLNASHAPWALVTSCTHALLSGWLSLLSVPTPPVSVAAEDVKAGKPDPACYELGRERLGNGASGEREGRVLVVEDAPAGVKAGKGAGCKVLGLATTHGVEVLRDAGADWVVEDLRCVELIGGKMEREEGGWEIRIEKTWVQGGE